MTHIHADVGPRPAARRQVRILLAILLTPFAVATVVGLIVLWPALAIGPRVEVRREAKQRHS